MSVAELQAAEQLSSSPTDAAPRQLSRQELAAQPRQASLSRWVKTHLQRHGLRVVDVEKGEPSVALLLLWEADHGRPYPSRAAMLRVRVITFSKRLQEAVAADTELSVWLQSRRMKTTLAPGLPTALLLRWSVSIKDAVGEPFLSSWKAYLASLLAQRIAAPLAALDPGCQSPRRKRQKRQTEPQRRGVKRQRASTTTTTTSSCSSSTALRPVPTTADRAKRLKAHASAAAAASGSATTTTSPTTSPPPSTPGGLPPPCAHTSCGRATQGPPT